MYGRGKKIKPQVNAISADLACKDAINSGIYLLIIIITWPKYKLFDCSSQSTIILSSNTPGCL